MRIMTFSRTLPALLFPLLLAAADRTGLLLHSEQIKAVLKDGKTAIVLPFENPTGSPARIHAKLEWLNPEGTASAALEYAGDVPAGGGDLIIPFPLSPKSGVWDRLRYAVHADGLDTSGILALSQIAEHVFELHVVQGARARPGELYRVLVSALHPATGKPVPGVTLSASFDVGGKDPLKAEAVTGERGFTTLEFRLSEQIDDEDGDLSVQASLGDMIQQEQASVNFDRNVRIVITPDKPLYQPGQTLHLRIVANEPASRAAANMPLKLTIEDPEDTNVFAAPLVTNRFGVAAVDWAIPDNIRLGDYSVRAGADDEDEYRRAYLAVKISRYDLPEFTVSAKPDRPYYMPGQKASVDIQAEYLFGKPVPRSHVRLVRETSRSWDYKLQKWDIDEDEKVYEGSTDAAGHFRAHLDLAGLFEDFDIDSSTQFEDLNFTASVRDASTGRTEERRFDLRITRSKIHIYPIGFDGHGDDYVSTSYADGTPAVCRVTVNGFAAVTTNRYGVARVARPVGEENILLAADDGHGTTGRYEERVYINDDDALHVQIRTDKTLYHPGEPVRVSIESSAPVTFAVVQVIREDRLLHAQWLSLADRRASIELPWRPEYSGPLSVAVRPVGDEEASSSKLVVFPRNTDLRVGVQTGQSVYRPGEEAAASFEVRSPAGRLVESAIGVAVVDAAVGERARTDGVSSAASSDDVSPDIFHLDPTKPFPEGLDLAAEAWLARRGVMANFESSSDYWGRLQWRFRNTMERQFAAVHNALDVRYRRDYTAPRDISELRAVLRAAGIDLDALRDPWDSPYRVSFDSEGPNDRVLFWTAGPDKAFGTGDDFVAATVARDHCRPTEDAMRRALLALPAFPSTERQARAGLAAAGIDIDRARDPWGTPYRFEFGIAQQFSQLWFLSAGPDRQFGTKDDFRTCQVQGRYFLATERKLYELLQSAKSFPDNEGEWNALLRSAGIAPLRDVWGRPLYAVFGSRGDYSNFVKFYTSAEYGAKPETRRTVIPITERTLTITLRSAGPDDKQGTPDDFTLADFSRTAKVEPGPEKTGVTGRPMKGGGVVWGVVTDTSGAVIPGAHATAVLITKDGRAALQFETQAGDRGSYALTGLPPGRYEVRIQSPGFSLYQITNVPVLASKPVRIDATLTVRGAKQEVTVMAAVDTTVAVDTAEVSSVVSRATPRLREYFPETLLWEPLLETGPDGRARIHFRLADNITTWKLSVMASTVDGETGTASADIRAFQPFFVDHNPPRILTQGDEIQLPVTIRNYLDRAQALDATVKPESWFALEGPYERRLRIAAGASANTVFPMRAASAIMDGKQRITATSAEAGDAIEKPVTVHPDGNQLSATVNDVFGETSSLKLTISADAIPDSTHAELRIYPNLISHLVESIEAILERPYGCGEQTISSTYPSLLLLKYLKRAGRDDHPLGARARRYLQQGFDRLRGYEAPDGGFTYWGRGEADLSLTAYALTFLDDAREFVTVPDALLDRTESFLKKAQRADGSWPAFTWDKHEDPGRTAQQTALIALALSGLDDAPALASALEFLSKRASQMDEPYLLAAFALGAERADEQEMAEKPLAVLRRLALSERGLSYWNLEANTPFYGWGTAGRLETTALALRAFEIANQPQDRELTSHALLFLLSNKDRYGVWYSTQATIRVLDAILEAATAAGGTGEPGSAEVRVNDRLVQSVPLPGPMEIAPPIRVDLSRELRVGENVVSLHRAPAGTPAQAQLVATWYVPWPRKAEPPEGPLRLKVAFDKTAVSQNDIVTCHVEAERVGFRGYGMLLGEIGLPPGADVDRQSLERALTESNYALSRYDVLPDRVIVYLWPRAGGTKFSFNFRPRFAMRAMTAPSSLYDYYNPDARTAVPPVSFSVR